MQSFMITLLICSVTMSVLALLYMAITPLLAKRYSVKSRYYSWLFIVLGLIIPFRPNFSNAFVKVDVASNAVEPIIQIENGVSITVPIRNIPPTSFSNIAWWHVPADAEKSKDGRMKCDLSNEKPFNN